MVGVIMGLWACYFAIMIFAFKRFFDWLSNLLILEISPYLCGGGGLSFDSQLLLGGGNDLVGQLAFQSHGMPLGGIVVGKILPHHLLLGSGCQGHNSVPMLVVALQQVLLAKAYLIWDLASPDFLPQFVICTMGMLAAAIRTPILAILLVLGKRMVSLIFMLSVPLR